MRDSENPYKLLKVDSEAPLEVVKAAYRALMKSGSLHPDLGGENHLAQEINVAYQILSDAEQRRKLDTKLKESKKFVAEEKKEISEYFVICLHCQSINRILHPQWVKQSQCSQCNTPFIITKKGTRKTTPRYNVSKLQMISKQFFKTFLEAGTNPTLELSTRGIFFLGEPNKIAPFWTSSFIFFSIRCCSWFCPNATLKLATKKKIKHTKNYL